MNNKGFTLVELLAIVVIISVIATVAVPNITNEINSSDKHTQNVVDESIENASKLYVAKYYAKQFINGEQIKFTLTDLENDGLLNLKSGVCDGFKNKDIVVNNHVYDYKELTTSCYSKSNETGGASTPVQSPTPSPSPTPTPSPNPESESESATGKISIKKIPKKYSYKDQNEQIFRRAMHYIIDEKKVVNGNFDGKIPACATDEVMCYESNKLYVNVKKLILYYSNKRFNDFSNVNKNLYDDGNTRQFTITYDSAKNSYSMGLCDRSDGFYYGYQYETKYSVGDDFKLDKVKKGCPNELKFYCCDGTSECHHNSQTFMVNRQFTCSANKAGVKISLKEGDGLSNKFGKERETTRDDLTKQFLFETRGDKIIEFQYKELSEEKIINIKK